MSKWADDLRRQEDLIRGTYRDWNPDDCSDRPDHPDDINAAADFINDATRDLPPDTFAAVLQAAIARRD